MDNIKLCRKLIERGKTDPDALIDAFQLVRTIEVDGCQYLGLGAGRKKAEMPIYNQDNFRTAHELNKEIRREAAEWVKNGGGQRMLGLYYQSHLFDAPHEFDSFMIYIEKDRDPREQFWLPRRKSLRKVCSALQKLETGELDELFLSMPPRCGKTTLMCFFLLWVMLRDSERSNLYCSYSETVVNVFYNGLIEILNDPYTYKWRDVFPSARVASTNAKDLLVNLDRRKRYASFTGRSLYGTLNGACDCNGYEIADDMHSGIEEVLNKDRLDSAWLKVDNNYLPRAKEGAKRLWIGTRWAMSDIISRRIEILENEPQFASVRWEVINTPALDEKDESNFDYLYGVGFSTDYFRQRRASFERNGDMASWFAQYQGVPVDRAGSVFEPDDLRYYNGILPEVDPDRIFMAVDPAWGGGDYCAGPVIYQYDGDLYVADVIFDNADKTVTQPKIASLIEQYGIQAVTIEGTRVTSSYADGVEQILREKGLKVNLQSNTKTWSNTGKEQRIFDKAPDIRTRMVFLASGHRSKEYEQFMQNVYSFKIGAKNKHDDAPDSLAQAISMFQNRSVKAIIMKRPF